MNGYTSEPSAVTSQPNPSVPTQNRYEICSRLDSQGQSVIVTDHVFYEQSYSQVQRSKRQRISTGNTDISIDEYKLKYKLLSTDDKLDAVFAEIATSMGEIEVIERKIDDYIQLWNKVSIVADTLSSYEKTREYRSIYHEASNRRCSLLTIGVLENKGWGRDCQQQISDFLWVASADRTRISTFSF